MTEEGYLDYPTCYKLADMIGQYQFTLPINSFRYFIYAANFFRDYGEFERAEGIYYKVFKTANKWMKKRKIDVAKLNKTINFASVSYAPLLILRNPPNPSQAIEYLQPILKENPQHALAYYYMAQCYQVKGGKFYPEAIDSFERAIEFDKEKKGFFWYEFGCFYRDKINNQSEAGKCFENSLKEKINLPACIALAELELQNGNLERAIKLLQQGLNIVSITRPEKEQRKQLESHIQILANKLGIK